MQYYGENTWEVLDPRLVEEGDQACFSCSVT
jgi:hypothetical protein